MKTLLSNGLIYDGTENAARPGSVIMDGETITSVLSGDTPSSFDGEVIDCTGKAIAPGFIDAHSHNDWFAAKREPEPFFLPFAEQGITTQVSGNCGFSPFGYESGTPYYHLLGSGLFDMGETFGDYSAFSGWRTAAEQTTPLNLVPLQGHGSVRIGLSGYENRPLTPEEMKRHNSKLEEAFDQGVFGLSFGLMYEPDRYAAWDELDEAARITARRGGIVTVHSRAQSAASTSYQPPIGGEAHNLRALKEMIELTRRTGVRMHYSHHIFVGKATWRTVDESLELIDKARAQGLDFSYDMYAMTFGVSVITVILPSWYLSLPPEKQKSRAVRARLALEIGVTKRVLGFDFDDIQIAWAGEGNEALCGKRVTELAAIWKTSPLSAYLRVVELSEGKGRVNMYRYYNDDIIQKLMRHEPSLFMTDAWIEACGVQNAAAYGCFPRFLQMSRDTQALPMESAIRKMTGATADRFGIPNRGYLRPGFAADITVFDPAVVAAQGDNCARPIGIEAVFVNGIQVVKSGAADVAALKGAGHVLLRPDGRS